MTTIGIIGSGHVGSNIAQAAITHGYDVMLSNSQGPQTLAGLVQQLGPHAKAATPAQAAAEGDFAVVAIPLATVGQVPVEPLGGKVVISTINYFPERLGHVAAIDDGSTTAPGILQTHLPTSRVVRAFSMINALRCRATATRRATPSAGRWPWPEMIRPPNNWSPGCTTSSASTPWTSEGWPKAGGSIPGNPRSWPVRTSRSLRPMWPGRRARLRHATRQVPDW